MRSFKTGFGRKKRFLQNYQEGVLSYRYKEKKCLKSPIDLAIYIKLVYDLKPATIIEIGTKEGGSAQFFCDLISLYNLDCHIWSIDINNPLPQEIPGVTFLKGDVHHLEDCLTDQIWQTIQHPILVLEDSAHSYEACLSCLRFFNERLMGGDFLIIEDGILSDLGLKSKYDGGPNRAISEFLTQYTQSFQIANEYCDMFGVNVTYNPNGYLRKLDK